MTSFDYSTPVCASLTFSLEKTSSHNCPTVCGVGINDSDSAIYANGRNTVTYNRWMAMLNRCYSSVQRVKLPTYEGCTVVQPWLYFSEFEKWMLTQDYLGKQLDKDILLPDNKIYGPDTCVFVSQDLNKLLLDSRAARHNYPLGVTYSKKWRNYIARVSRQNFRMYLGVFPTPLLAHQAWQRAKADIIADFDVTDSRVRAALDLRVAKLRYDIANNLETISL